MDYIELEEAIGKPGLRLVLTAGVPGPWGEAAKAIFFVKQIPFVAVRQKAGDEDETLRRWTNQTGAPAAMYESERPRSGWAEILMLAERLAPRPALLPAEPDTRALAMGLSHEICGEQGLGWCRRLMVFDRFMRDAPRDRSNPLAWKYDYDPATVPAATRRVADLLALFAGRLRDQYALGSRYLVGDALSAVDIYWATFAAMLRPLSPDLCPMPDWMRPMYDLNTTDGAPDVDPILLTHRDFIYETHLQLPMDF